MNNSLTFRLWGAVIAAGLLTSAVQAGEVKVGSPAPEFKVATWVKGDAVKKLEKGKIYVVEFWATWCGPCKASIPHLTELAKKFKDKVTFIGVDSFEQPADNLDGVKKFVADMGDKMDYNVAVDGSAAFMADNWMKAANQETIPTAFIVGKDGSIQWIGNPLDEDDKLEDVLAKVVGGNYSADDESAKKAKLAAHLDALKDLVQAGNFKGAVTELDATIKENPTMENRLGPTKFEFMARLGDPGTNAYAKHLFEDVLTAKDDAIALNQVSWFLVDDDVNYKGADYALAVKIAEKAVDLSKGQEAAIMDTLGYAYFKNGQIDKAIEAEEKAVKLCDTDKTVTDDTKVELKDRLAKFKKAKGGG